MRVNVGDKVRDLISGLEGIAISRTEFLYGCVRLQVQPQETKDGKPVDTTWIDEPQLKVVNAGAVAGYVEPAAPVQAPAGPRPDATRSADARR